MDGSARSGEATPTEGLEALEAELVGLAGHLAAAHHRWLRLLAEFDTRQGWPVTGRTSRPCWARCWRNPG